MTVADNTSRNQYTATSGQTVFAYTFEIVDKDHIVVLQNGTALSEGTDYTVSNVGNDNGGNITLTSGATAGDVMTLYRDMPYSRTQNYTNSGDFLASEVNADFDELWLAGEQTDRSFSQSIRKPITDSDSISMELPEAATRANKFVKFDATGAVDVAGATVTVAAEDVSITDAGNYYTSGNVEGALQEVGADLTANTTKLNTIETGADVTDTANVTAAGAVMDSELTNEAAVKALNQGVATTDSPTFAGLTVDAVTYTGTDGTDGQVLMTDGAGNASFEDMPSSSYLDVTDFGATGDGSTDDTTAIQNAINHASNNDIQTIFFPDGHYKYTTLRLYHDATDNPNFQGSSASYTGDNATTVFAYDWYIKSASDLIVKVDGVQKILDTDYTVSGVGSDAGGIVTFTSAPGSSLSISIAGPNRDGRFVFLGTGRIAITDLRTYDGTSSTEGRLYGSVLESTSGGGGIIIDPTAAFDSKDARNFLGEKMTFIANNTTQIIEAKACPGLSFEFCSFKQLNNDGDGIIAQNAWFFTFTNCFLIGPDKANATGTGIIGGTDFFAGQWNINQSLIDTWRDCVSWEKGEFVNVSFRDSAIQNANRYAIHGSGGVINQLLLDNTYFENVGVTGTSFVYGASNVIRNLVMQSNFMLCGNNSGTSRITGPSVDLVNCDSFSLSGSYVFRMYTPIVRIGNTRSFTDVSGRVENNFFRNDATIPRAYSGNGDRTEFGVPYTTATSVLTVTVDGVTKTLGVDYTVSGLGDIAGAVVTFTTAPSSSAAISIDATNLATYFLFEGKLPEFKNNIWTGFTSGLYDSSSIFKLFDDTSDYALNYQDGLYGVNSFTRLGLGDISVETGIGSSPKGIAAGSDKTYYDLTHTISGGLALTLPNNTGTAPNTKNNVPDGRMFIVKNNSASADFIIVRNRSDFSTIQRLQRGMTGIFVLDAKGTGKFNLAGVFGGDDPIYDTVTALNSITINEVTFDGTDGTSGQFLTTDGAGTLSFATASGTGITAIVQDTTPQLGGDLESNGNDILFADNDKAIFGAGSDLQIYHDGVSRIKELGAGGLYVDVSNDMYIRRNDTSAVMAEFNAGVAKLMFDGSQKLATTSTGIDVTGNLTVDAGSNGKIEFGNITTNYGRLYADSTGTFVGSVTADPLILRTTNTERMRIDSSGQVGIGVTSPSGRVHADGDAYTAFIADGTSGGAFKFYKNGSQHAQIFSDGSGDIIFRNNTDSERMRINSSGAIIAQSSLSIGASSPADAITIGNGTSSSQGIGFVSTNTGNNYIHFGDSDSATAGKILYDHANDNVQFYTGGTLRGFYNANGLTVSVNTGGVSQTSHFLTYNENGGEIQLYDNNGQAATLLDQSSNATRLLELQNGSNLQIGLGGSNTTGLIEFRHAGFGLAGVIDANANWLFGKSGTAFGTAGVEINQNGVAGKVFMTRSGGDPLSLNRLSSDGQIQGFYKDGTQVGSADAYSGYLKLYGGSGSAGSGLWLANGAMYPVGTTNLVTDAVMDIGDSSYRFKDLYLSNGAYLDKVIGHDDPNTYISFIGSDVTQFVQGGAESMRITAAGDLLVGKSTTAVGTAGLNISSTGSMTASIASGNTYHVYDTTNSAYRFYVSSAGQINATSTSITAISDESLKQNIRDLDKGLDTVLALQPRRFDWKNGDGNDIMGFVAQEVEEVMPELVHDYQYTETETKLGLKMGDMVPTLVKAIQDQQEIIENLKSRIEQLEGAN